MSRYRPPPPPKSPHITRPGFEKLQQESRDLWVRRREVVQALSEAAAEGDRSENAEYIYRKKQLREMDRRIRYLQKRLPQLKVIDAAPADPQRVFFGASVVLEDEAGQQVCYRIVGADEFDPQRGWISVDSPMSRALLGKGLDDEVRVETPAGARAYWVMQIGYVMEVR